MARIASVDSRCAKIGSVIDSPACSSGGARTEQKSESSRGRQKARVSPSRDNHDRLGVSGPGGPACFAPSRLVGADWRRGIVTALALDNAEGGGVIAGISGSEFGRD